MSWQSTLLATTSMVLTVGLGCSVWSPDPPDTPAPAPGDDAPPTATSGPAPMCAPTIRVDPDRPFRQVSWMTTDATTRRVDYRLPRPDTDGWTDWKPVEITFSEHRRYNARILLDDPVESLELRGGPELQTASLSIQPDIRARRPALTSDSATRPDNARRCSTSDPYLVDAANSRAEAPALPDDLAVSRTRWNAIAPKRHCRRLADPDRITFHHTFVPATGGDDTAAAVRQIQSYHLNERGWCDIGYHFVIDADGTIFEGSTDPRRLAAHVGGDNEGNVGIALIGDFSTTRPTPAQHRAATELTGWLHDHFEIPLDPSAIRGHGHWPDQQTDCPGDGMQSLLEEVLDNTSRPAGPGTGPRAADD